MADEAGGVAIWRDPVPPDDAVDIAALRAAPSPVAADADVADEATAQCDSLDVSLGEPGAQRRQLQLSVLITRSDPDMSQAPRE